jgi:hypothetical protein
MTNFTKNNISSIMANTDYGVCYGPIVAVDDKHTIGYETLIIKTYFEKSTDIALYKELLNATKTKKKEKVTQLLSLSLLLEIKELLTQVNENFYKYQKARLLLIKTKKHLKALTKKILKSIGNSGMMGVGGKCR